MKVLPSDDKQRRILSILARVGKPLSIERLTALGRLSERESSNLLEQLVNAGLISTSQNEASLTLNSEQMQEVKGELSASQAEFIAARAPYLSARCLPAVSWIDSTLAELQAIKKKNGI